MVSAVCKAKDPRTCPYHGSVIRMNDALQSGNVNDYMFYRKIVEDQEHSGWLEDELSNAEYVAPVTVSERLKSLMRWDEEGGALEPPIVSSASDGEAEKLPASKAREVTNHIKAKYPGLTLRFSGDDDTGYAVLDLIAVPKNLQGQGVATEVMNELISVSDRNGWNLALTPTADFGSSKARLIGFYQKFGFVPNSGRNKDYSVSQTMIRVAQTRNETGN